MRDVWVQLLPASLSFLLNQLNWLEMARTTILEYLDNFQRHAREAAYVHHRGYRVQRWTYGEVLANAHRFARELDSREIATGDKVLIWGENCAEWVVAFFGCLLRGAIVVPIDKIATPDFAQRVAQQVDAKLCVCSSENQIADVSVDFIWRLCATESRCAPRSRSRLRR